MKKRLSKSLLSLLLAAALLFSVIPMTASVSAAETDTADTAAQPDTADTGAVVETANVSSSDDLKTNLEKSGDVEIRLTNNLFFGYKGNYEAAIYTIGSGNKTLDLNGYKLSYGNGYNSAYENVGDGNRRRRSHSTVFKIPTGAALTVTDLSHKCTSFDSDNMCTQCGVIKFDGEIRRDYQNSDCRDIFTVDGGELTIDAGAFIVGHSEKSSRYSYAKVVVSGSTVLMYSGKTVINGGYLEGNGYYFKRSDTSSGHWTDYPNAPVYCEGGKLVIQDGHFKGWNNANAIDCVNADSAMIRGGEFRFQSAQKVTITNLPSSVVYTQGVFNAKSSSINQTRTSVMRNGSAFTDFSSMSTTKGGTYVIQPKAAARSGIGNGWNIELNTNGKGKTASDPLIWEEGESLVMPTYVKKTALYYPEDIARTLYSGSWYAFTREYELTEIWTNVDTGEEALTRRVRYSKLGSFDSEGDFINDNLKNYYPYYYPNEKIEKGGTFLVTYRLDETWNNMHHSVPLTASTTLTGAYCYIKVIDRTKQVKRVDVSVSQPISGKGAGDVTVKCYDSSMNSSMYHWSTVSYKWLKSDGTDLGTAKFEGGETYKFQITIKPVSGYTFADICNYYINSGCTTYPIWAGSNPVTLTQSFTCPLSADDITFAYASVSDPRAGFDPVLTATAGDSSYTAAISSDGWKDSATGGKVYGHFAAGKTYEANVVFSCSSPKRFTSDSTFYVNGTRATVVSRTATNVKVKYSCTTAGNASTLLMPAASISRPYAGEKPKFTATAASDRYTASMANGWYLHGSSQQAYSTMTFTEGQQYDAVVTFTCSSPDNFTADTVAQINGMNAEVIYQTAETLKARVTFTAAARDPYEMLECTATVAAPVAGTKPKYRATSGDSAKYSATIVDWYRVDDTKVYSTDTFEAGKNYYAVVEFRSLSPYKFCTDTKFYVNNSWRAVSYTGSDNRRVLSDDFYCERVYEEVRNIDVTVGEAPALFEDPSIEITEDPSAPYTISAVKWQDVTDSIDMNHGEVFELNKVYMISMIATVKDGYKFNTGVTAKINGKTATVVHYVGEDAGNKVELSYKYPALEISTTEVNYTDILFTDMNAGGTMPVPYKPYAGEVPMTPATTSNTGVWAELTDFINADTDEPLYGNPFVEGETYTVRFTIKTNLGGVITSDFAATVNGEPATVGNVEGFDPSEARYVYYTYPVCEARPDPDIVINSVSVINVEPLIEGSIWLGGAEVETEGCSLIESHLYTDSECYDESEVKYEYLEKGRYYAAFTLAADEGYCFNADTMIPPQPSVIGTVDGTRAYIRGVDGESGQKYLRVIAQLNTIENPAELLSEVKTTITAPSIGKKPTTNVTSAEPEKYTATLGEWYVCAPDGTDRSVMENGEVFEAGKSYCVEIVLGVDPAYKVDETTKFYINNTEADSNGSLTSFYGIFTFPAPEDVVLTEVKTTITAPVLGKKLSRTVAAADTEKYNAEFNCWYICEPDGTNRVQMQNDDVFEAGKSYCIVIDAFAKPGYKFDDTTKFYINDIEAVNDSPAPGMFYVVYTFPGSGPATGRKLGDVDGDGKIDIFDASSIQKSLAGMAGYPNYSTLDKNSTEFKVADVDGDGKIDIFDASLIQKFIAGDASARAYGIGDVM